MTTSVREWVVPDLSLLSEDEFLQRLNSLKRSHKDLLKLCDQVGLNKLPADNFKNTVPIASVNRNCILTTCSSGDSLGGLADENNDYHSHRGRKSARKIEDDFSSDVLRSYNSDELLSYKINRFFDKNENDGRYTSLNSITSMPIKKCRRTRSLSENEEYEDDNRRSPQKRSVTVVRPFNMTLREEQKKMNSKKSRSLQRMERDLKLKHLKERNEHLKNFSALPLPPSTSPGLYRELEEHGILRKHRNLLRRNELLNSMSDPFSFIQREKERKAVKTFENIKQITEKRPANEDDEEFKASPFPAHIFSEEADENLRKRTLLRQIESLERSKKLMRSAQAPTCMKYRSIKHKCHPPSVKNGKKSTLLRSEVPKIFALTPQLRTESCREFCNHGGHSEDEINYIEDDPSGWQFLNSLKSCPDFKKARGQPHKLGRENTNGNGRSSRTAAEEFRPKPSETTRERPHSEMAKVGRSKRSSSHRRTDEYWIDDRTRREIEAELDRITL